MSIIYMNSIQDKINKICNEKGELYYKRLDIPVAESYESLSILTRKTLLNKLVNSLSITKRDKYGTRHYHILTNTEQIANLLNDNDYLNGNTQYFKFYIKENKSNVIKELNLEHDINNQIIVSYMQDIIVKHIIKHKLRLPLINLYNWNRFTIESHELYESFTYDEIICIENQVYKT